MSHTYEFNVSMSCGGCSGAIDRVLKKLDGKFSLSLSLRQGTARERAPSKLTRATAGVDSYEVSLENQTAKVVTDLPYATVLEKISKTGKKVNSATADGVEQSVQVPAAA